MIDDGRHDSGGEPHTTNQRMELMAVLEALRSIEGPVDIHSDSTYVVNCFNDRWYEGWLKRGWKNSQKKPVANRDIWEPLIDLYLQRSDEITFTWVKGHSGERLNEIADQLAVEAAAAQSTSARETEIDEAMAAAGIEPTWPSDRAVWVVGITDPDLMQRAEVDRAIAGLDPRSDVLVTGLRRGCELDAAIAASAAGVEVHVVLPFEDPAAGWPPTDRASFDQQVERAASCVVLTGDRSAPGDAIERRNQWIGRHVVGAVVVGDATLSARLDEAGVSVVSL